jgi:hypothetical protein
MGGFLAESAGRVPGCTPDVVTTVIRYQRARVWVYACYGPGVNDGSVVADGSVDCVGAGGAGADVGAGAGAGAGGGGGGSTTDGGGGGGGGSTTDGGGGGGGGSTTDGGGGGGGGSTADGGGGGGTGGAVGSGDGVGVGVAVGGGVAAPGPVGGGGSPGVGVSLGGWEPPGAVVPPGDPLDGWLGSGVGVSDLVFVGERASPVGGAGVAEGEDGVPGHAEAGDSWSPPATT